MGDGRSHQRTLRLGTRGSQLARWQADWVASQLQLSGHRIDLVEITTRGDVEPTRSIEEIGTRGVFTKEIQRALLDQQIDLAVHSLKDLPTEPVEGLLLAAVPPRASVADALVLPATASITVQGTSAGVPDRRARADHALAALSLGARIGTGSLRRQAQLRHLRPDLRIAEIRGNVDTRLRKLDAGQFDAIVLAEAGLSRLGLADRIASILPLDLMLPAVGQGALAIECRVDDESTRVVVALLNDPATHTAVRAERSLLAHLRGGCMAPVGALGQVLGEQLLLTAAVLSADGATRLTAGTSIASLEERDAEQLGRRVADDLLAQGAAELIRTSRAAADD